MIHPGSGLHPSELVLGERKRKRAAPSGALDGDGAEADSASVKQRRLGRPRGRGIAHERDFAWGGGFLKFKPAADGGGGAWQATCPRYRSSHHNPIKPQTRCRFTKSFRTPEGDLQAQLMCKHFICSCVSFTSRAAHQKGKPTSRTILDAEDLERRKLPEGWKSGDDLPSAAAAAAETPDADVAPCKPGKIRGRGGA